jgi:hypothetical protein
MIALLILAFIVYGTAKFYSPSLVFFVVEQTLIEKSPPGTDRAQLRERLGILMSAAPNQNARMEKLFQISAYLEKVQLLTPEQLNEVMEMPILMPNSLQKGNGSEVFPGFPSAEGTFFSLRASDINRHVAMRTERTHA